MRFAPRALDLEFLGRRVVWARRYGLAKVARIAKTIQTLNREPKSEPGCDWPLFLSKPFRLGRRMA
jgi:hypothetical protein